jgi:flagellar biosynthesis protein FliR
VNQVVAQFGEHQVVAFFLVLARVGPLFVLAPLFSSKSISPRVRGIVAVALAIGLSPVVASGVELPTGPWELGELIAKEMLIGTAFAFTIGAVFAAVQVAGAFLDTLIGFSFGATVDPVTGNQSSVLTQLYALIGVLVFIAIGGDAWVIRGLARTYDVVGLTQFPALGSLVGGAADAFAAIFGSAVQVAAPLILTLVVTDAAFGVVSRVVPQLNVFGVGFPTKVTVGLVMLGVTLPFAAGWLSGEVQQSVAQALRTLRVA